MHDLPVRSWHANDLCCAKNIFVKVDGAGRPPNVQIWRNGVISLGNWLYVAHCIGLLRLKLKRLPQNAVQTRRVAYRTRILHPIYVCCGAAHRWSSNWTAGDERS